MPKTEISSPTNPLWMFYLTHLRQKQDFTYRLFIYGFGLCVGYLGITDHHSLMYAAGQERDGMALIYIIIAASVVGLIEMALNTERRTRAACLKNHRHFILLALAFCFLGQLFVAYDSIRSGGVTIFYTWPGIVTMWAAISDARKRGRESCVSA